MSSMIRLSLPNPLCAFNGSVSGPTPGFHNAARDPGDDVEDDLRVLWAGIWRNRMAQQVVGIIERNEPGVTDENGGITSVATTLDVSLECDGAGQGGIVIAGGTASSAVCIAPLGSNTTILFEIMKNRGVFVGNSPGEISEVLF